MAELDQETKDLLVEATGRLVGSIYSLSLIQSSDLVCEFHRDTLLVEIKELAREVLKIRKIWGHDTPTEGLEKYL